MCEIELVKVVGIDENGDGERDFVVIVGRVRDCDELKVGYFEEGRAARRAVRSA